MSGSQQLEWDHRSVSTELATVGSSGVQDCVIASKGQTTSPKSRCIAHFGHWEMHSGSLQIGQPVCVYIHAYLHTHCLVKSLAGRKIKHVDEYSVFPLE